MGTRMHGDALTYLLNRIRRRASPGHWSCNLFEVSCDIMTGLEYPGVK